jgi:hypothetical protein
MSGENNADILDTEEKNNLDMDGDDSPDLSQR